MDLNFFIELAREFVPDDLMDEGGMLIASAMEKAYYAGKRSTEFKATDPELIVSQILHEISGLESCSTDIDISSLCHKLVGFGEDDISCHVVKCQHNIPKNEHFFCIHTVSSTEDLEFDLHNCECNRDALLAAISEIQEMAIAELSFNDSISLAILPGETISDILATRGVSLHALALNCELSEELLGNIVSGEEAITPEIAAKLEKSLNVPNHFG